ncbi:MAG: hypothetical protein ACK58L_03650 [Planctomycetota bacterium]
MHVSIRKTLRVIGSEQLVSSSRRVLLTVAALSISGCGTWQKSHQSAITHFESGQLHLSQVEFEKSQRNPRSEKELLELDRAVLDLASGDVHRAETRFRRVRRELEFLEQKAVGEQAKSIMTDSRAIAFSGRDFEKRMLLNLAMLTSLLSDGTDSFAYSLQASAAAESRRGELIAASGKQANSDPAVVDASTKSTQEGQVSTVGYARLSSVALTSSSSLDQPLAFSAYLSAGVQSEYPSRADETEKALDDVRFWNTSFQKDFDARSFGDIGNRCRPGHGTLHVIALVGHAPKWVSESAEPTTGAMLIADRIISAAGKHTLPPTISSVKIACPEPVSGSDCAPSGAITCRIGLSESQTVPDMPSLDFTTIVSMNDVVRASYEANRDREIADAIVRRVTKKAAIYVLKETQNVHRNSVMDIGINVAGIAWEALEKPDTRSWQLLPNRIDVTRVELPAGQWSTTLQVRMPGRSTQSVGVPAYVQDGRNTYVVCIIPRHEITGHILIGGADHAVFAVQSDGTVQPVSLRRDSSGL